MHRSWAIGMGCIAALLLAAAPAPIRPVRVITAPSAAPIGITELADAQPTPTVPACMPEIYAYAQTADLARKLGIRGEVADAITDAREQLLDCLSTSEAAADPDAPDQHRSIADLQVRGPS